VIEPTTSARRGRWTRGQAVRAALGAATAGGVLAGARMATDAAEAAPSAKQDVEILNLFLLLERVQEAFYREAVRKAGLDGGLLAFARAAAEQEHEHVAYLLDRLGSRARSQPSSDFGDALSSPERFSASAVELEEAAIAAYIGQAPNLTRGLVAKVASMLAVEARQVAWVRDLAGQNPAPRAADPAAKPAAVLADLRKRGFIR
jgi:hypothetical protein